MQDKELWAISGILAVLSAYTGFAGKLHSSAAKLMEGRGALDQARSEREQALKDIYGADAVSHANLKTQYPLSVKDPETKKKVDAINQRWWSKQASILKPANNTIGEAWNMLPSDKRNEAILFGVVTGVAVGGISYGVGKWLKKSSSKTGGGAATDDGGAYIAGDTSYHGDTTYQHHNDGGWVDSYYTGGGDFGYDGGHGY
jgi:hypothetical protein